MRCIVTIVLALCVLAAGAPHPSARDAGDESAAKLEQARHVAIALATRPDLGPDAEHRPFALIAVALEAAPPPPRAFIANAELPPRHPSLRALSTRSSRGPPRG